MKHVQYKGDIAYHVIKRNGEQTWTRLGPKDEAATWAIYETLERALVDSDEHFSAVADRFIKAMLDPKSPWKRSEKTKKEYSRQLRQGGRVMRVFGKMKISNIKPKHIAQFLDKHPSPVSAGAKLPASAVLTGSMASLPFIAPITSATTASPSSCCSEQVA